MKKSDNKSGGSEKSCAEWLRRGARTFFQAVIGYAGVNIVAVMTGVSDGETLKNALLSLASAALAAGVAALMNMSGGNAKNE